MQAEYYYQFTDHYHRLMVELGINVEESINSGETKLEETQISEVEKEHEEKETLNQKKDLDNEDIETDYSHESIESVSFISEPANKKRTK